MSHLTIPLITTRGHYEENITTFDTDITTTVNKHFALLPQVPLTTESKGQGV